MRTYSRETWEDAQRVWTEGEYGDEWALVRSVAAHRGMIYPPSGTRWDSWEDPNPSQRAIIYRALQDTPKTLHEAVRQSWSWAEVVHRILRDLEDRREGVQLAEKDDRWERKGEPDGREATVSLKRILDRISES